MKKFLVVASLVVSSLFATTSNASDCSYLYFPCYDDIGSYGICVNAGGSQSLADECTCGEDYWDCLGI